MGALIEQGTGAAASEAGAGIGAGAAGCCCCCCCATEPTGEFSPRLSASSMTTAAGEPERLGWAAATGNEGGEAGREGVPAPAPAPASRTGEWPREGGRYPCRASSAGLAAPAADPTSSAGAADAAGARGDATGWGDAPRELGADGGQAAAAAAGAAAAGAAAAGAAAAGAAAAGAAAAAALEALAACPEAGTGWRHEHEHAQGEAGRAAASLAAETSCCALPC